MRIRSSRDAVLLLFQAAEQLIEHEAVVVAEAAVQGELELSQLFAQPPCGQIGELGGCHARLANQQASGDHRLRHIQPATPFDCDGSPRTCDDFGRIIAGPERRHREVGRACGIIATGGRSYRRSLRGGQIGARNSRMRLASRCG